jgi:hypothetical protein
LLSLKRNHKNGISIKIKFQFASWCVLFAVPSFRKYFRAIKWRVGWKGVAHVAIFSRNYEFDHSHEIF